MRRMRPTAAARRALTASGLALALAAGAGAATADAAPGGPGKVAQPGSHAALHVVWRNLHLLNGWHGRPYGTAVPQAALISGIVHLKGAIRTSGSNNLAFDLPSGFQPDATVVVPVDLCGASHGDLVIYSSGSVYVQAQDNGVAPYQCFTSLDGASFSPSAIGFTRLTLLNGWLNSHEFGTRSPRARAISGIVHLMGSLSGGAGNPVFVLPRRLRPRANVIVSVDVCHIRPGLLDIAANGTAELFDAHASADAVCFTSLDGASFALSSTGFTKLKLRNGWKWFGSPAARPQVKNVGGIITFQGEMMTNSHNSLAFVLPRGFRPRAMVYVQAGMGSVDSGRLVIYPNGGVFVEAEQHFADAQFLTSLDGVSFGL